MTAPGRRSAGSTSRNLLDAGAVADGWDDVAREIVLAAVDALAGLARAWRAAAPERPDGS